jgi:hypothetical protein
MSSEPLVEEDEDAVSPQLHVEDRILEKEIGSLWIAPIEDWEAWLGQILEKVTLGQRFGVFFQGRMKEWVGLHQQSRLLDRIQEWKKDLFQTTISLTKTVGCDEFRGRTEHYSEITKGVDLDGVDDDVEDNGGKELKKDNKARKTNYLKKKRLPLIIWSKFKG